MEKARSKSLSRCLCPHVWVFCLPPPQHWFSLICFLTKSSQPDSYLFIWTRASLRGPFVSDISTAAGHPHRHPGIPWAPHNGRGEIRGVQSTRILVTRTFRTSRHDHMNCGLFTSLLQVRQTRGNAYVGFPPARDESQPG